MAGVVSALYGATAYIFFLCTFLYAVGFVENLALPVTIDSCRADPIVPSLVIDIVLLTLFALQHSVMARPGFKRWWTVLVPKPVERATYVLFASAALALLCWQWRPLPAPVWDVTAPVAATALQAISWLGWVFVLLSTCAISHFQLFGVSQVYARLRGRKLAEMPFQTPSFYRWVRHPIYVGFLLAFWFTPHMTLGQLVFAVATTGYILIGIQLEERDLIAVFGDRYRLYRSRVPMLLPRLRPAAAEPRESEQAL
jgi:protein-S-isoprenylcysteine O-methyltransferase Ste14